MSITVSKFGGSSMATGDSIRRVAAILEADASRTVCIVSAPGKRLGCLKMTDLLRYGEIKVCLERLALLIRELNLDMRDMLIAEEKLHYLCSFESEAIRMSFGEWLGAYLLSCVTCRGFIDATDVIKFSDTSVYVDICWSPSERVILPGFYGTDTKTGTIKLFPRGGSDITASLIAQATQATLCENWTDVSGVFEKDPNRYTSAQAYETLSYQELRSITSNGAEVFHPEAIAPLEAANIPLKIMNTFAPYERGTLITQRSP